MDQIRVGDRISTVYVETGRPYFDDVVAFLHRSETTNSSFVRLHMTDGSTITLTRRHLIYAITEEQARRSQMKLELGSPQFAESVKPGDFVIRVGNIERWTDLNNVVMTRVVDVTTVPSLTGVFAPLTTSGNLVVDGVLASSYAEVNSHRSAHWAMAPVRTMHTVSKYLATASWSFDYHSMLYTDAGVLRYGQWLSAIAPYLVPELFV